MNLHGRGRRSAPRWSQELRIMAVLNLNLVIALGADEKQSTAAARDRVRFGMRR
jgi:hypothetical protein